jgi:tetratricopeptide (TPR) repeat protein
MVSETRAAYRDGVDCLVQGEPEKAVERLEGALCDDSPFEVQLALGKAYLALGDGPKAAECFEAILTGARALGTSVRAYVNLLTAHAAAIQGRRADVGTAGAEVVRLDPRLASAANALRDKVERGERPVFRL